MLITNVDDDFGLDWPLDLLRAEVENSLFDASLSCGLVSNDGGWMMYENEMMAPLP